MPEDEALQSLQQAIEQSSELPLPARLWEQWPDEPDEHYTWFLLYLSMGAGRNIRYAYQLYALEEQKAAALASGSTGETTTLIVPDKATSKWWKVATRYHWEERAGRYDVFTLSQLVPQTVQMIFATITEFAAVTLEQLKTRQVTPSSWPELRSAVETLASYISPEIIQATVQHATDYPSGFGVADDGEEPIAVDEQ